MLPVYNKILIKVAVGTITLFKQVQHDNVKYSL